MFATDRIDEASQQSSPECRRNLMNQFSSLAKNKRNEDEFSKELERNLEEIDNRGAEDCTEQKRDTKRKRESRVLTAEDDYLVRNEETRAFLEAVFPQYQNQTTRIALKEFVAKAVRYFFPDKDVPSEQMQALRKRLGKMITTTDQTSVSINALAVLTKESDLRHILMENMLEIKYQMKANAANLEHQRILEQFSKVQKQIKLQKQQLSKKAKQLKDKQNHLYNKQKEISAREKQLKGLLVKQYDKLEQKMGKLLEEHYVQLDKKSGLVERSIRYKIQILESRIEEANKVKTKQKSHETRLKDKILRVEKDRDEYKNKCKQVNQLSTEFLAEKEALVKKQVGLQDKIGKLEKKTASLKQTLAVKDQLIKELSLKIQSIQKEKTMAKDKEVIKQATVSQHKQPVPPHKTAHVPCIKLMSCIIQTANTSIPKIVRFYRQQPNKPQDFDLSEVFYPSQANLRELSLQMLREILSEKFEKSIAVGSTQLIEFFVKNELFFFNCDYSKQKNVILEGVVGMESARSRNKPYGKDKIGPGCKDLYNKCQKWLKKILKLNPPITHLTVVFSILLVLLAQTPEQISQSINTIILLISQNSQIKQHLLNYQFTSLFLVKASNYDCYNIIDLCLEYSTTEFLQRFLSRLAQFDNYTMLINILQKISDTELIQKLSIILQRYSYAFKRQMVIQRQQLKIINSIIKKYQKNKGNLIAANLLSVLQHST